MRKNECGLNSRLVELDENNFPTQKTGAQFNDTQKNKHTHNEATWNIFSDKNSIHYVCNPYKNTIL